MPSPPVLRGKKARFVTLGCKLNFSETATLARLLSDYGVTEVVGDEPADICLINTCAVTEVATAKGRQAINRLVRQNKGALVVVTGCYAQLDPEAVRRLKGVSIVLGTAEKAHIIDYILAASTAGTVCHTTTPREITSFVSACSRGNRTRYFLKVQDGCSYYCSYCTIPLARGHSRNPSIAALIGQARAAASEGAREIVLTGVNIGDFGRSTGEQFIDLVRALDDVEGIQRYRISSLEPDLLSDELIHFCAHESRKFMPHFHIPLQSGANEVLQLMHRRYDTRLFAEKVSLIKTLMPHAFIGVDIMVGCRGETEELFEESVDFVQALPLSKLHVFPYSERPNTAALKIEHKVDEREKHRRADRLLTLSEEKQRQFYTAFIGSRRPVLFEKAAKGQPMHGFTDNYIRVELPPDEAQEELDNEIRRVLLTDFNTAGTALTCVIDE